MEYESKSLTDYIAMIKRRRNVLLASLIIITLIGVYVANAIPATYRSTSRFLIEQQDIPENVVQSTVNTYVDEQIQAVRTRVMSSTNLLRLIEEHDLYGDLMAAGSMQPAVERLRENAVLETEVFDVMNPRSGRPMRATISFTLSFDHNDPETARDVAADLASLYLSENVESRTGQVEGTLQFIRSEIERYSREVEETGQALTDFKANNLGNLPELMSYNMQTIERTERQIDGLDREIRDARNRQMQLSSELARLGSETVYDDTGAPILNPAEQLAALQLRKMQLLSNYSPEHPDVVQVQKEIDNLSRVAGLSTTYISSLEEQLAAARATLADSRQRYSPDHPDVIRSQRTVENLADELDRARAVARESRTQNVPSDPYAQQLQKRIDAEESNVRTLEQRKRELQAKVADLETKVALSPRVESEYEILNRNNQMAIANLNEARAKLEEAARAQKLEAGGSGDRFTLIEPAKLPQEPYKPNRTAIMLLAFVLAVGVGVVIATVLDTLDDTVKGSRDLVRLIDAPPMAVIPYLETEEETKKRKLVNIYTGAMVAGAGASAYLIATFVG